LISQTQQPAATQNRRHPFHRRRFESTGKSSCRPAVAKTESTTLQAETTPQRKIGAFERQASDAVASWQTNTVQKFVVALIFSIGSMVPTDGKKRGKLRAIIEATIRSAEYARNDAIAAALELNATEDWQKIRIIQKAVEFCIRHNGKDEIWNVMVGQPDADETAMSVEAYVTILVALDRYRSRTGSGAK
jgi:hypothetical protein